jgi:class II lanthipeptide synthase
VSDFYFITTAALRPLRFHSVTAFSWFGVEDDDPGAARLSVAHQEASLLGRLQARLYSDFYVHGEPRPTPPHDAVPSDASQAAFVERLRVANSTTVSCQSEWRIYGLRGTRVVVEREGLRLWVTADRILESPPHTVGQAVTLQLYGEQLRASPGFYVALGHRELRPSAQALTRVYWNVGADQAARLLSVLTHQLNTAGIPFRFKVADRANRFHRADAGVLYIPTQLWTSAAPALEAIHRTVGAMRAGTPAYTKVLAKGIAVAEDPGEGASFGAQRSRVLATAALRTAAVSDISVRVASIERHFTSCGIDTVRPWLRPDGLDIYDPWDREAA